MPEYEYRCPNGHVTELRRDPEVAGHDIRCPDCGEPARRVFRLRGIGFKGGGFHNTDTPGSRMRGVHRRADGSVTHWFGDGVARNILTD